MPAQQVISGAALTAGLRNDFVNTYNTRREGVIKKLANIYQLGVPSDKLTELYAYPESAPHPRIWERGEDIGEKEFKYVGFNVSNKDWAVRINWHENDRQDDQTRSLFAQARKAGENFGILDERVFYQILLASTDFDLLRSIPNAPDGAVLHAALDGSGANRFGVTGGNLIAGAGVATSDDIRNDFFAGIARIANFLDTEGQPLMDPGVVDAGVTITYGVSNWKVFADAFVQGRTLEGGAAVTNIIMDSGLKVNLAPTSRITDDDWFIFVEESPVKAIFQQERQALRELSATMDQNNSDSARNSKNEYIQWDARRGYGVNLPYMTVKINN